jgi:hypothetical protein
LEREARGDYKDDRVRPPLKKDDCRGSHGIAMSRLCLKVNSVGTGVARVGEEFAAEVKIHNGSSLPIDISVAPSLSEVEASDPDRSYSWATLGISLDGFGGQEPWQYTLAERYSTVLRRLAHSSD